MILDNKNLKTLRNSTDNQPTFPLGLARGKLNGEIYGYFYKINILAENLFFPMLVVLIVLYIEKYIDENSTRVMFFNGRSYSSPPYKKIT